MKKILIAISMFASTMLSFSQDTMSSSKYEYFMVLYTLGENWDTTKQVQEQLYCKAHSSHLAELRKTEKISIGGRYSDTAMLILKATDEEETQHLVRRDSAIQNKIFKVDVFSFDSFYSGCIE